MNDTYSQIQAAEDQQNDSISREFDQLDEMNCVIEKFEVNILVNNLFVCLSRLNREVLILFWVSLFASEEKCYFIKLDWE